MVFLAALQALLLAGPVCAESQKLTVGYIPIGDCLQLYVADDNGYFAEEGLEIEKKPMKGGAVIAPSVEAGEADVGWSNAVSVIIAHAKGFDFGFLTSGANSEENGHRVHSLLVGKDSPIASVKDLEGGTVAINTLGNINELSLDALFDANGVDMKKVKLVEVPFPHMEAALKKGSVDAVLEVEPFVTLALEHGTAKMLVPSVHKSYGDKFMIGSWFAKKSWVEKHPKLAAAFARAVNRASAFIRDNPDKVGAILVANTKLTPELAKKITLPAFDPKRDPADIQKMIDTAAKYGFIPEAFPAGEVMITNE